MRTVSLLGPSSLWLTVVFVATIIGDHTATAFSVPATAVKNHRQTLQFRHAPVFMSQEEEPPSKETETTMESSNSSDSPTTTAPAAATTSVEADDEEPAPYPLDVPSPILLASSMILAIAATGSVFELLGGNTPQFGFAPTAAIVVIGYPMTLFLFYASIRKAIAETEEDDKKFLSGQ